MRYRKKPLEVEAVQWTGKNVQEILEFCQNKAKITGKDMKCLYILTIEGNMYAHEGDYIVRGIKGEYYPCNKTVFEESYTYIGE